MIYDPTLIDPYLHADSLEQIVQHELSLWTSILSSLAELIIYIDDFFGKILTLIA